MQEVESQAQAVSECSNYSAIKSGLFEIERKLDLFIDSK